jgi:threonine dehydratase
VGRRLALLTRMPDRPGNLARLLDLVARAGANLVEVQHVREGIDLHVRETAVQVVLETRGPGHADAVLAAIAAAGYEARVLR